MLGNVAIPSGTIYPDGLPATMADPVIQASVRPEGSFFTKSVGYQTIRPGRSIFQHNKGQGIHFTPTEFAENVAEPSSLPALVTISTAADHVEVADVPGSENLTVDGQASEQERVLVGESNSAAPTGSGSVRHRGRLTLPDMGDREAHRPLSAIFHGLEHPIESFRAEYQKSPIIALAAAAGFTGLVYMVARDFERSYRGRERSAAKGGGITSEAAPVAAAPAAAAQTSGNVVEKTADTAVAVVEEVVEAAGDVVEDVASAVSDVAETAADAVTGG